jgi:hypothetical protein
VSYSSFSTYGAGRLVAVQNQRFNTMNGSTEGTAQFIEMYGYTQAGQPNAKMLPMIESTWRRSINAPTYSLRICLRSAEGTLICDFLSTALT